MAVTPDTQIVLTVKCEAPEDSKNIRIDGVKNGVPLIAKVVMASVLVCGRFFFDIILSTTSSSYLIAAPMKYTDSTLMIDENEESDEDEEQDEDNKGDEDEEMEEVVVGPNPTDILSSLMRDLATTNMAFTFGFNGSARNVALWVHQSVLLHQPYMASLIDKLRNVESSDDSSISGVKSIHVTEYSLESYCSLIRFLYTGTIDLDVDLEDFAIGCPPNRPYSPIICKKRPPVEGLFAPAAGTGSTKNLDENEIKRRTAWPELFQVADCYQIKGLREHCKGKIVASISEENVLEMLFKFGYKYKDLKDVLLQFVADHMDKLFVQAKGDDPFDVFKDHPERYSLLIQALQLKFKIMT
ncbi:hypothetical protein BGZ93_000571 [Podila epicladia]|nr:hypothetical protein BGZ92_002271 [Podila epicladia]KAG0100483.1 hypothetical protein BGZ93_000571 [Podila epicladia]